MDELYAQRVPPRQFKTRAREIRSAAREIAEPEKNGAINHEVTVVA